MVEGVLVVRFNVFNLCLHENVGGWCQIEGRKGNGKGCRERKDVGDCSHPILIY